MHDKVTELRELETFHRISLGGAGNLTVVPGDSESIQVHADPDLLPYVITDVVGDTLFIELRRRGLAWFGGSVGPVNYTVAIRELTGLEISGAGTVSGSGMVSDRLDISSSGAGKVQLHLSAKQLSADISGSGSLRLSGEAQQQVVTISGAGEYSAAELTGTHARVCISGAGRCTINVAEQLDVQVSGCGHVDYIGEPRVESDVSGVGYVGRIGAEALSSNSKER